MCENYQLRIVYCLLVSLFFGKKSSEEELTNTT